MSEQGQIGEIRVKILGEEKVIPVENSQESFEDAIVAVKDFLLEKMEDAIASEINILVKVEASVRSLLTLEETPISSWSVASEIARTQRDALEMSNEEAANYFVGTYLALATLFYAGALNRLHAGYKPHRLQ